VLPRRQEAKKNLLAPGKEVRHRVIVALHGFFPFFASRDDLKENAAITLAERRRKSRLIQNRAFGALRRGVL
jgi:hypothetical protein